MIAQAVEPVDDDQRTELLQRLQRTPHREEAVLAGELELDHTYQRRSIRVNWVHEIAQNFDPDLFQPLKVNRRRWDNNRLFVFDGQHRLLALREMGWDGQLVPCTVYDNLDYETEAKLFDTQRNTRPLTPAEQFRSRLARHEADELLIDGLVRRIGYQLNLDTGDMDGGRIPGVQSLKLILHRYGSGVLTDVLDICRDSFGTDYGPRASFLVGMALFLSRYQKADGFERRRLVTSLRAKTMNGLVAEGAEFGRASGRPKPEGVAYKIHETYNYRLTSDRRLAEWSFGRKQRR